MQLYYVEVSMVAWIGGESYPFFGESFEVAEDEEEALNLGKKLLKEKVKVEVSNADEVEMLDQDNKVVLVQVPGYDIKLVAKQ